MLKRVLCLSGGGAKGIAQIEVLKKLESDFGKPLHEVYDLIAGTSVGAINAAIVASGKISMVDLEKQYVDILLRVFKKRKGFGSPKYDRNNFVTEWNNIVGDNFLMGDVKTKLMLTSVDLVTDINHFFKSWHDDDAKDLLSDVVCRSFAAPLYFGQVVDYGRECVWSDGGVGYANYPITEVKTQVESFGWYDMKDEMGAVDQVQIDTIGCLYFEERNSFEKVAKGGWLTQVLDFMSPISGGLARVQSRNDQVRMMQYLSKKNSNLKFRYWDCEIPKKLDKLDGIEYCEQYKYYGIEMSKKPIIDLL